MAGAAEMRWWSANTVAVVTGSNKGLGYEISKQLARNEFTTVMTARDETRGTQAVEALRTELGFEDSKSRIAFHRLDVCSEESALAFSKWLHDTYGGVDLLINNAGVLNNEETLQSATATLQTNYYGVKNVTKALLPVLRPGARVLMVSSGLGQLHRLGNHYREEFANREKLTEEKVDEFVESFSREMKTGKGPGGWPKGGWSPSYCISKMAVNGYMSVVARDMSSKNEPKVYVNSFTPGYTHTDMTGQGHTVEEGAMTGVWLALHPPEGYPQGKFFADKCRGEMSF